ncbi:polyamine ABC transporter substrate-binding protein [Roseomonas xinghualingensis]|uniref:polyamine ABC transporter substrate-binding protein n=1 Tax=Roseomonas xinghualingensis TaxID=2986475 RepID=UPI0021F108DB|nr:polyamine ABC transporter substrate-binding protein [Roseomonas sp. SXEYE001]MCV4207153.1 polyamine ABC transporter substrate-binding protein [Roseomonas sp. SXEYE001]
MKLLRPLLLALLLSLPAAAQESVLNVYNWADYIDPQAIEDFQRETGIRVRYDAFDSLEALEGKLSAGRSGYDVIVPTNEPSFARLVRAGALRPLDRAKIPNWTNQDAALLAQVASSDPGNRHGAIYLWGTIGMGLRPDRIKALAPDAPLDSLDLILKPANARRIARCGIAIMDSGIDVMPSVLRWLGKDPNSNDAADQRAAEQALLAIRPHVRAIISSAAITDALAQGEYCAVIGYSGDVVQAQNRAREAGREAGLIYVQPKEGAQLWFDMLAIPADAPNPEAAQRFIDYMLRPEVMAGVTNQVHYPNAIPASRQHLRADVAADPNIYPPPEVIARSFTVSAPSAAAERARSRSWSRFKAGR